jgi:hypothetical protein
MMPDVSTRQKEREFEDISQSGHANEAVESENENENNVVLNHYYGKGGGGMYGGYGYGCGDGLFGGGGFGAGLMGGLFGGLLFGRGGFGHGFGGGGGFDHGAEGRLHNDLAIQGLKSDIHANSLQACNNTAAIISNSDGNSRFLGNEICNNRTATLEGNFALLRANDQNTFGLSRQIDQSAAASALCCCETQRSIDQSTFATSRQLCDMQHFADKCCCETNLNIERQGHANQITALQNTALLQAQHCEILNAVRAEGEVTRCLIKDTARDQIIAAQAAEIQNFRDRELECRIAAKINCCCCQTTTALNQIGTNQVQTAPTTSQWPPMQAPCCGC